MKVVFKQTHTKYLDFSDMLYHLFRINCKFHTFECFLYNYLECEERFDSPDSYDNWYEIRTSVYNNLFVYCAENNLEEELRRLKELKDF